MRILIDDLVAHSHPEFASLAVGFPQVTLNTFDPFLPPMEITARIAEVVPDLLVVDSAWLVIAPLLMTVVRLSGCIGTRCIVGTSNLDNVLKIRASHGGFVDVIDLTNDTATLIAQLEDVHRGQSRLDCDPLWRTVPRPTAMCDIAHVPTDSADLAILELVRIGLPDAAIAESIHMSQQTVRNRVSAMLRKSGLTNRTQLAWAFTNQTLTALMIQNMNART